MEPERSLRPGRRRSSLGRFVDRSIPLDSRGSGRSTFGPSVGVVVGRSFGSRTQERAELGRNDGSTSDRVLRPGEIAARRSTSRPR
jgi:hypothetical protein